MTSTADPSLVIQGNSVSPAPLAAVSRVADLGWSSPEPSAEYARQLTDRIKVAVEGTWHLITEAYQSRAWSVLGYASWDDYCTREFGTARLKLPREDRISTVQSLRDAGLSLRAIAAATRRLRSEGMNGGIAVFGIAWLTLAEIDADAAASFFDLFTTGADLPPGSPLLLLRKHFQLPKFSTTRDRTTLRYSVSLIIRAWNAWRSGKTLTKFRVITDFPEPK